MFALALATVHNKYVKRHDTINKSQKTNQQENNEPKHIKNKTHRTKQQHKQETRV